jgi:protoheme IX farnesyltransferase
LLPPLELHPIIEYSHRTAASLASLLIVATGLLAVTGWRRRKDILYPALAAVLLLVVQVLLGAITVRFELPPQVVLAHLATAMMLLGATCVTAAFAWRPVELGRTRLEGLAIGAALATYLLILTGSLVIASRASASCSAWPLCGNGLALSFEHYPAIQLLHRSAAGLLGLFIVASLLLILRRHGTRPAIRALIALTLAALVFQVSVGAAVVLLHLPPPLRALHLALAAAVWSGTVLLAVLTSGLQTSTEVEAISGPAPRGSREIVLDYVSLAKPRIIVLLLITTLAAMMMAARGWPATSLVLLTLLGGAMAAAGASALNCWIDRDIDRLMVRTRSRPLPAGRMAPAHALVFGLALGTCSFLLLAFFVNPLAAALSLGGFLFYVIIYTAWLKRSSVQNIVIGGAAGAVPPLVGWAAVRHGIDLTALGLFAIIFLWTPPHFWSLALRVRQDYARAGVPMLPVVRGQQAAKQQIFWYTLVLGVVSLALYFSGALGRLYLVGASALGLSFIVLAALNLWDKRLRWSRPLFSYSLAYLSALFAVMVLDRIIA